LGEPPCSLESDLVKLCLVYPPKAAERPVFAGRPMVPKNNDTFYKDGDKVIIRTNNSYGILGGLSNGCSLLDWISSRLRF
jgi:hypothetical protein